MAHIVLSDSPALEVYCLGLNSTSATSKLDGELFNYCMASLPYLKNKDDNRGAVRTK